VAAGVAVDPAATLRHLMNRHRLTVTT